MFTVQVNEGAFVSLKNGAATVNTANYTFSNGELILSATYLAGLTNGQKTFALIISDSDNLTVVVHVGD